MKKSKLYLSNIEKEHPDLSYEELYDYIFELISDGKLAPVKSALTNGRKPALPVMFWKHEDEKDYTDIYKELDFGIHPLVNTEYYRKHPEKYEEDAGKVRLLSNYLKDNSSLLSVEETMNERSFEIFKKEKFFQKEGGIKFCEKLGIDRNKLNYYETSEPLSYYSHSKDFPQNILIIENKDTFYDIRRYLRINEADVLGIRFNTLIYGAGKGIWNSFADYASGAESYFKAGNELLYFGDIDYEGIIIYEHLVKKGFRKRMQFVARYSVLCGNSIDRVVKWRSFGINTRDEQINMLFSVLLYIMEYSLKEEDCTIDDIAAFVDEINYEYYEHSLEYENSMNLARFIVEDVLGNTGVSMYFKAYDYDNRKYKDINIRYIDNKVVYQDGGVKRTSYYLTYESQLEKLTIDLANIDSEQKNVEEMFLEYIKSVNANIAMIDKNSTINVRGRNIKMLRIQVPDWDSEKEHYRIQLHDFFERVVKHGIETIESNKNLTEYLGNTISTKNLYDDVIGIRNIKIKLYKIEAEKEVPISWAEVSSNSGGEGFLSAFVILTCLLSYMRRDESDLFSTAEEGKVLIMDNPFAQTYSAHLLKPLMEMAKKTNTQLICLSGLGGDSIYNRFDNIYVLKLVDSNIRNGIQRVEGEHIKGEEVKKMVLSDFKTEQLSLFDMVEED